MTSHCSQYTASKIYGENLANTRSRSRALYVLHSASCAVCRYVALRFVSVDEDCEYLICIHFLISLLILVIPLLLSRSPHFACTCLFYCPIYAVSFVFRTPWHQNLLSSQLLGDRAYFQIASTFVRQPIIMFFICLLLLYKVLSAPVQF